MKNAQYIASKYIIKYMSACIFPGNRQEYAATVSSSRNLYILLTGILLMFSTGCIFTRGRSFHYSIFPQGDRLYYAEIEFSLRPEEIDDPKKAGQVENKVIAAAKFALEKNNITYDRVFIGESVLLMHDGLYAVVYAENWGNGGLDYSEIFYKMIDIIPRISIAHGKAPFSGIQIGTEPVESVAEKPINKIPAQKDRMQKFVSAMDLKTMFPDPRVRQLAKAAGNGNIKKINQMVLDGIDVNSRGSLGATPLYWASRNYEGFKRLLELGANPNVIFDDGGSVIRDACYSMDTRILRLALEHGGNPNLRSASARSLSAPFFVVTKWGGGIQKQLKSWIYCLIMVRILIPETI